MKSKKLESLTSLEEEIMRTVWELNECSSAEVLAAHAKTRTLAPTTIRTILTKLYEKGYVKRVPTVERGYRMKPAVSRESVGSRLVSRIVSTFYGGSPHLLVSNLLREDDIDEDTLQEIEKLLRKHTKGETK